VALWWWPSSSFFLLLLVDLITFSAVWGSVLLLRRLARKQFVAKLPSKPEKKGSKKNVKAVTLPPPTRGRPSMLNEAALEAIVNARDSCTKSLATDVYEHNFMDSGLLGDPSSKQMKCSDCAFEINYNKFLYGDDAEKSKPCQTLQICVPCSLHWRGPSRYYVCGQCAEEFSDTQNTDIGIVNRHAEIFYRDEPKVLKERKNV
jgi:hypothetical protein